MKKYLSILVLVVLVTPQVAMAAWWNPFSWSVFQKKETNVQQLESRIKDLEKKLEDTSAQKVATTTAAAVKKMPVPVKKEPSISIKNTNKVSSRDLVDAIDYAINNNSYLESINKYSATIDYYVDLAKKSKEPADSLASTESDPYLLSMWSYYSKIYGGLIEISSAVKYGTQFQGNKVSGSIPELVNSVNVFKAQLNMIRSETPDYYPTEEAYSAKFKSFLDYYYDTSRNLSTELHNNQKAYLEMVGVAMTKVSDTKASVESYFDKMRSSNRTINTAIYQPVVYPTVQIPKTTYCNSRGTGINGNYEITCNQY